MPKTAIDLLAKIVEEVDGTKCGELCCYKHWALVFVINYGQLKKLLKSIDCKLRKRKLLTIFFFHRETKEGFRSGKENLKYQ